MSKIIIGIHGLGNKPPAPLLTSWWKRSIRDGQRGIGQPRLRIPFELVYWAHFLHPKPLDPKIKDENDPLYLEFPYSKPGIQHPTRIDSIRKRILDFIEKEMDKLFLNSDMSINFSALTDLILRRYFKDLEIYYSSNKSGDGSSLAPRDMIREELTRVLNKHRGKDIMLIAHSMGSIIAYDVLARSMPDVNVDTFITAGSPLGLPVIMNKIHTELCQEGNNESRIRTPECVRRRWYNFSDLEDKVALNYNLADDYDENSRDVQPVDQIVTNGYMYNGKSNPHKSYGYLRTPEMARVINDFLAGGEHPAIRWARGRAGMLFTDAVKD